MEVPSPQEQGSGMLMRVGRILGRNMPLFDVILCVDVCDTVMRSCVNRQKDVRTVNGQTEPLC